MNGAARLDPARRSAIARFVAGRRDAIVELLRRAIEIDSVTGREGELAHFLAAWFAEQGIECRLEPAHGRHNLVAWVGDADAGRTLVLSGHLDTVPPDEGDWQGSPWTARVVGDRVIGLGASDMKASLVAIAFALLAHREAAAPGRLIAVFTVEEETSGAGTQAFLAGAVASGFLDPRRTVAVVAEPTGLEHVSLGNRGGAFVKITCEGQGGHGSRPHLARHPLGPLRELLDVLPALVEAWNRELQDPVFGPAFLTPTVLQAGDPARHNVIPHQATLILDGRLSAPLAQDDFARFRRDFGRFVDGFRRDGFTLDWRVILTRPMHRIDAGEPIAALSLSVLRDDLGRRDAHFLHTPAGNDAAFFAMHGIPTTNKVGPGHPECAHRVGEFVTVDNLLQGTEYFAILAARWLEDPGDA